MQRSLRVARVDVSGFRLLTDDFAGLDELHRELQQVIRRHLPGVTASVLALPVPGADGKTVDWYSDLAGQPAPLTSLPPERRAAAKAKLEDRLASMRRLADELPRLSRGSEPVARTLRAATHYPDDTHVYVIGDEPVLTLWGFVLVKRGLRGRPIGSVSDASAAGARRRAAWIWGSALGLVLALAGGGWLWLDHQQSRSLEQELGGAIAGDCAGPDRLEALRARLDRLDPARDRYAEIRRRLDAELVYCADTGALAAEVAGAGWDCSRLSAVRQGMEGTDLTRQPAAGIAVRLEERIAACETAASYSARLDGQLGDCALVADLDGALGTPPTDAEPMVRARERLDRELALCRAADELGAALTGSTGDCDAMQRLDLQLGAQDVSRPPLTALRGQLDAELALCAKAATYRQALVDAQMNCAGLRELDQGMAGEDASREPLLSIRRQLDEALEKCRTLEKLDQSLRDIGLEGDTPPAFAGRARGLGHAIPAIGPERLTGAGAAPT